MKSFFKAVAILVVAAAPLSSFAQSNQPVTRAQVRAELVQVEEAGYNPTTANSLDYPANIQAAEARAAVQNDTVQGDAAAYGPSNSGTSQMGHRAEATVSSYSPPIYIAR
jgi:hypothetical protein